MDGAESPAHPAVRGEERELISGVELEAAERNKLEGATKAGMSTYCQQVVPAQSEAGHFDA